MKILVTGGNGQLGRALGLAGEQSCHSIIRLNSTDLDVTKPSLVKDVIGQVKPDTVVHAAAYTKVDLAESEADTAFRVNVAGTQNIAAACLIHNAKMVYVSTDFVFDGKKTEPYTEFDKTNPLNIYGKSKLEGESIAARICPKLFIARTSWLYGDGANFVRTVINIAKEQGHLSVVNDQTGCPTYTSDLAAALLELVETDAFGTYHMANNGCCTWYEFAKEILKITGIAASLTAITSEELKRPAARPRYSVMRNYMLELTIGDCFRHWEEALAEYLGEEQ